MGNEDLLWQNVTTELSVWRTSLDSDDTLRCVHSVTAYYKEIGDRDADAKAQTMVFCLCFHEGERDDSGLCFADCVRAERLPYSNQQRSQSAHLRRATTSG